MKNLIIASATIAAVSSFVFGLILRAKGLNPNMDAFFVIMPVTYAFALTLAFFPLDRPRIVPDTVISDLYSPIILEEYRQYVFDCMDAQEVPVSLLDWFESAYWYDIADDRTEANKVQYPYSLIQN